MSTPTPGVDLSPIIDQVLADIKALEQDVIERTAELAEAREKLATARGRMEMIGTIQQLAASSAQGNGEARPVAPRYIGEEVAH